MIYTILVALDADPLPPLADLPSLLTLFYVGYQWFMELELPGDKVQHYVRDLFIYQ